MSQVCTHSWLSPPVGFCVIQAAHSVDDTNRSYRATWGRPHTHKSALAEHPYLQETEKDEKQTHKTLYIIKTICLEFVPSYLLIITYKRLFKKYGAI